MRLIRQLEKEEEASLFSDYLYVQGIANEIEETASGAWGIWVHSDKQLDEASRLLKLFEANPNQIERDEVIADAAARRKEEEKEAHVAEQRTFDRSRVFSGSGWLSGLGRVTLGLIAVSVVVAVLSRLGGNLTPVRKLFIAEYVMSGPWWEGLLQVRQGEVWRLVTPIFLHFGPFHLVFNMLWLRDLGGMVERAHGSWWFLMMVIVLAVPSNVAQYAVSGPSFGGMSGVVFGLLGYIWIRGKFDPLCRLYLHRTTVTMMLIWFFLCFTGFMNIANTAHAVGLGIGMAWGYLAAKIRPSYE